MRDAGRPEERHLVADGEAEAELAADVAEDWRLAAFSSEEEDAWLQERLRRPAKRRRKQRQPDEPAERNATVAVLPAEELAWRFAAVPLTWQGAPCAAPTELTLTLAPGCSNIGLAFVGSTAPDAASSSSGAGATCQGSLAAPSAEAAEALLSLLRSGHLCCGLHSSPAPNSGSGSMGEPAQALHLGLGDKALADTAEYPEEQQQVRHGPGRAQRAPGKSCSRRAFRNMQHSDSADTRACMWFYTVYYPAALLSCKPAHALLATGACAPIAASCAAPTPSAAPCRLPRSARGTAACCSCCWAGWRRIWTQSKSWSIRQPLQQRPQGALPALLLLPLRRLPPLSCSAARCAVPEVLRSQALPPSAPAGREGQWPLMQRSSMRQ